MGIMGVLIRDCIGIMLRNTHFGGRRKPRPVLAAPWRAAAPRRFPAVRFKGLRFRITKKTHPK